MFTKRHGARALGAVLALLCVRAALALDPLGAQQVAFGVASQGGGDSGFVEASPAFAVNESSPEGPKGAPSEWPLNYELFREREVVAELVAWLKANGVRSIGEPASAISIEINYNTSLRASGRSRGDLRVVARKNISAGEIFASVPLGIAVTPAIAFAEVPGIALEEGTQGPALVAWLLKERAKGKASPWHPYIQSLPHALPAPSLFSEELLAVAEYEELINLAKQQKQDVHDDYVALGEKVLGGASEAEFAWAVAVVKSRLYEVSAVHNLPTASAVTSAAADVSAAGPSSSSSSTEGEGSGKPVSWEDEFLLGDEEVAELEAAESEQKKEELEKLRKEAVPILLPLGDLFDWSEHPSASWEVVGSSVVYTASRDIAAGEPIFLALPTAENEVHFMDRAFVPMLNSHDSALIFKDRATLIGFFRKNFLGRRYNENYQAVMDDTVDLGEEFVQIEVRRPQYEKFRGGLEYGTLRGENAPHKGWFGGRINPGTLCALASCHSITINNDTPMYKELARASLKYGWILEEGITCDLLASDLADQQSESMNVAGAVVHLATVERYKNFSSTLQDDFSLMGMIQMCRELQVFGRTSTGQEFETPVEALMEESCPERLMQHLGELEALTLFRISKKAIYTHIAFRLKNTCKSE